MTGISVDEQVIQWASSAYLQKEDAAGGFLLKADGAVHLVAGDVTNVLTGASPGLNTTYAAEVLVLSSDGAIYFFTGVQSGLGTSGKRWDFGTDGSVTVRDTVAAF